MSRTGEDSYDGGAQGEYGNPGEDVYNRGSGSGGVKRTMEMPEQKLGIPRVVGDRRLYSFDRIAALAKAPIRWDVSKDDRMSKVEAGNKMVSLIKIYGLVGASPSVLEAFHNAVYYGHSVNGASVLQPGRAVITIGNTEFEYSKIVTQLGNDNRRFFRAYADEIRDNNRRILHADDPHDYVMQECAENLRQTAAKRGLSRFPDLVHDSADACTGLTDAERTALVSSKNMIFSAGVNMADRNRFRPGQSGSTAAGSMFVNPTVPGALGDSE